MRKGAGVMNEGARRRAQGTGIGYALFAGSPSGFPV